MSKTKRQHENGALKNPPAAAPVQTVGAFKLKPAATYLGGLSTPTMHRLVAKGLLRPNRVLRHLLFSREELDRFLREGMAE